VSLSVPATSGNISSPLARLAYQLNDQRTTIKKEINELTGSAIIGEKYYSSPGLPTRPKAGID
jgi:hypothetical protein